MGKDWVVFMTCSLLFVSVCYFQPDPEVFLQFVIHGFLALGVLTFVYYITARWWHRLQLYRQTSDSGEDVSTSESESRETELEARREAVRQQKQEEYDKQAQEYDERVLKPREEAKAKKKEEEYYRFTGPAWKGRADKLGSTADDETLPRKRTSGSSKEAAESRQLPDHVINPPQAPEKKKPQKRKIVLPEEPALGSEGCITIALRTPLGRTHKRRFLCSHTVQLLLDFMTSLGFSDKRYMICQSYPRCCVSQDPDKTLTDVDITHDIALNVEEKD